MKKFAVGALIAVVLVAGVLLVEDPRFNFSRRLSPSWGGPLAWAAQQEGDCSLCHFEDNRLKPHPYPKQHPLTCFDCHFESDSPQYTYDPNECFSCHEAGGEHAGLMNLSCFDCHGPHDTDRPPDFSNRRNCFLCHEATAP